jgi:threonine/homoserine/homoserine lactone efflux protein
MTAMIFAAFQLGFIYSLLPGPVIIAGSQRAVTGGWRHGLWFVVGVTLSDLFYILLVHWGISDLLASNPLLSLALGVLGGAWLIKLGLDALRVPMDETWFGGALGKRLGVRRALLDGLLINLLSPVTILGWMALGTNFVATWGQAGAMLPDDNLLALLSMLLGIVVWQILIVAIASVLRRQMNRRLLKTLSLVGGICLIVYGLGALVSASHLIA